MGDSTDATALVLDGLAAPGLLPLSASAERSVLVLQNPLSLSNTIPKIHRQTLRLQLVNSEHPRSNFEALQMEAVTELQLQLQAMPKRMQLQLKTG